MKGIGPSSHIFSARKYWANRPGFFDPIPIPLKRILKGSMLQNAPLPLDSPYIKYLYITIIVDFYANRPIISKPSIIS